MIGAIIILQVIFIIKGSILVTKWLENRQPKPKKPKTPPRRNPHYGRQIVAGVARGLDETAAYRHMRKTDKRYKKERRYRDW